jgi:hypothetical protein
MPLFSKAKTTIESNIEYGKEYVDSVTGLKGVAVAITKFQYGCVRIALQPKVKDDGEGKVPELCWFDEESLIGVEPIKESTGGPTPNPKQSPNPKR